MHQTNIIITALLLFLGSAPPLFAQYNSPNFSLEGTWELVIDGIEENSVLIIEPQTGPIAIGTLDGSPLIINRNGHNINFVCDRKERGKRKRVRFIGSAKETEISGKMYFHPGKYEGLYVVWEASKLNESTSER